MATPIIAKDVQFDFIREMHSALIRDFLENIQDQDKEMQNTLCYQMNELGDYIAAHSKDDSPESLEIKIRYIKVKRASILKMLERKLMPAAVNKNICSFQPALVHTKDYCSEQRRHTFNSYAPLPVQQPLPSCQLYIS